MHLEIISPDQKLYAGDIKRVNFPGKDGRFGVLPNHAPLISSLKAGKIGILDENEEETNLDIKGGVVEVVHNKVMVLAD